MTDKSVSDKLRLTKVSGAKKTLHKFLKGGGLGFPEKGRPLGIFKKVKPPGSATVLYFEQLTTPARVASRIFDCHRSLESDSTIHNALPLILN